MVTCDVHKSQHMVRFCGLSDTLCCHATNYQLQAKQNGVVSSDIKVFVEHHRGPDPSNSDQLCSQSVINALVSCHYFSIFYTIVLSLTCISIVFAKKLW
jgi:hypothetical protein